MADEHWPGYGAIRQEMPLGGYAVLLSAWTGAALAGLAVVTASRGDRRTPGPLDLLVLGAATHKVTRTLTKDWVTAPIRAPFVEYERSMGGGEVRERARGTGLRKAIGDLLTCPFCTGPWVAGTLVGWYALAPRTARLVASLFSAVAISDFLHRAYEGLARASTEAGERDGG